MEVTYEYNELATKMRRLPKGDAERERLEKELLESLPGHEEFVRWPRRDWRRGLAVLTRGRAQGEMTKSKRKKMLRWAMQRVKRRQVKAKKKEAKRAARASQPATADPGSPRVSRKRKADDGLDGNGSRSFRARWAEAWESGPQVVLDCEWWADMTARERSSLVQQVM